MVWCGVRGATAWWLKMAGHKPVELPNDDLERGQQDVELVLPSLQGVMTEVVTAFAGAVEWERQESNRPPF